jgi:hypothetical protein
MLHCQETEVETEGSISFKQEALGMRAEKTELNEDYEVREVLGLKIKKKKMK